VNLEQQMELDRFEDDVIKAIDLAMKYTATDVWGNLRRYSPTDHGRLAGSWTLNKRDKLSYTVYTNVHYALHHQQGTGIYGPQGQPIQPLRAKALKFYWGKVGQETVWRGDLTTPGQKAAFVNWAKSMGFKPFLVWPKGIPPYKPDGQTPYVDYSINRTQQRTQEFARRAVAKVGGSQ